MFFRLATNQLFSLKLVRLAAILALLWSAACSRGLAPSGPVRLAILRFENLSGDAGADWIGRALPEILQSGLEADRNIYTIPSQRLAATNASLGARRPGVPGISAERTAAMLLRANRLLYGQYSQARGRLRARVTTEDAATGQIAGVFEASANENDVGTLAASLARQISGQNLQIRVPPAGVLRPYAQALEAGDAAASSRLLEHAIAAGPDFGPPYRYLAELKIRARDPRGAAGLLESALSHGPALGDAERARIALSLAAIRNDLAARRSAAESLTALEPQDPANWQILGETAMAQRDAPAAANAYRKVTVLEPSDANAWNQLGYAACYADDLTGGLEALRKYQALRPGDPNAADSMGELNLIHGRFAEAEKIFLENARKNPGFLNGGDFHKAAMARLMTGDIRGATPIANEYLELREKAQDPSAGYYRAQWSWLTGKRKEAIAELERTATSLENGRFRESASQAYTELAIWRLMLGNREEARQAAARAAAQAGPATSGMAGLALYLAQPPASPEEWASRAARVFPNAPEGSLQDAVLGYALLLEKDFPAAAAALSRYAGLSLASPDPVPAMALAWARLESGKIEPAAQTLRWNPVPSSTGPGSFAAFYFPRIFYLRGLLAQKQGRTGEARANYRLFLQLSGPDPLQWGEEARAQAAL